MNVFLILVFDYTILCQWKLNIHNDICLGTFPNKILDLRPYICNQSLISGYIAVLRSIRIFPVTREVFMLGLSLYDPRLVLSKTKSLI